MIRWVLYVTLLGFLACVAALLDIELDGDGTEWRS